MGYDEAREAAARAVFGADGPHTHPWEIQHHARKDEFRTMANAAIDAFLAKISETHAVVPREPTEAMLDAAVTALERHTSETEYSTPRAVWAAMLTQTAPAPATQPDTPAK